MGWQGEMNRSFDEVALPEPAAVRRLAVNESGFVFDPMTGRSFSVNESGRQLLTLMAKDGAGVEAIVATLVAEYDAPADELRRDLHDFVYLLREQMR